MRNRLSLCAAWTLVAIGSIAFRAANVLAEDGAGSKAGSYKVGLARAVITPAKPMWMSGYGGRNKPSEGKLHDLNAKALAIEDPTGHRVLVYTTDLIGLPNSLSEAVAAEIKVSHKLERKDILLTCSHTHSGPVVAGNLESMYDLPAEQWDLVKAYGAELRGTLIRIGREALDGLAPAKLEWGTGKTTFACNRRLPTPQGYVNSTNPNGPVDHSVPVLRVSSPDGKLRAALFGYACHNTTLDFYQWCGDYAGFAQINFELKHPGATAMFFIGCGADANPLPRRTVELCEKYGRMLAEAVDAVLEGPMHPVAGPIGTAFTRVDLPFEKLPSGQELETAAKSQDKYQRCWARTLLAQIAEKGKLDAAYSCPLEVWQVGNDLTWVAISGETVVDYSLRLKRELGPDNTWVAGYCNDVYAYIPSQRVLKEGGYEGESSQIIYGMPSKWAPVLEERIIQAVHEMAKAVKPGREISTALR
jgi:neutral ceramidase